MIVVRKERLDEIDQLAKDKFDVFDEEFREDGTTKTGNLESLKSMSEHVASDYGDRYLMELVQNAYDAHPVTETCGKIKIVLFPGEGTYGTLYIANGGSPFKYKNLDSICHIGYSQKPPGENIGGCKKYCVNGHRGLEVRDPIGGMTWPLPKTCLTN